LHRSTYGANFRRYLLRGRSHTNAIGLVFSGVIGGTAALSPADVEQAWLFCDPPGTANEPTALTGTVSVTKTFEDSREISHTPKCWWLKRPSEDWLANSGCSPALRVNEGQATATDHAAPNEGGDRANG